jgi:hypothetical protein
MRQSLSLSVVSAVGLSLVLVVVAVVDQVGGHGLADHAAAIYAPAGTKAAPGLLYGLVYTVAAVDVMLWFLVFRAVRARRRWAPGLAVGVVVITAVLAVTLLVSSEYGSRIFPPLWGVLAALPAVAGVVAVVLSFRVRPAR